MLLHQPLPVVTCRQWYKILFEDISLGPITMEIVKGQKNGKGMIFAPCEGQI